VLLPEAARGRATSRRLRAELLEMPR